MNTHMHAHTYCVTVMCCDVDHGAGISFVRVGNATSMHSDMKRYCLSELAKARFEKCMLC